MIGITLQKTMAGISINLLEGWLYAMQLFVRKARIQKANSNMKSKVKALMRLLSSEEQSN